MAAYEKQCRNTYKLRRSWVVINHAVSPIRRLNPITDKKRSKSIPLHNNSFFNTQFQFLLDQITMSAEVEKNGVLAPVALHSEDIEKSDGVVRDYSGAIVSLDPVEKALVKKLDMRIMVSLT